MTTTPTDKTFRVAGWYMPFKDTPERVVMKSTLLIETPGVDVGVIFKTWQLGNDAHLLAVRDGRTRSWGSVPIPTKIKGSVYNGKFQHHEVEEIIINPKKMNYTDKGAWLHYRNRPFRKWFSQSRTAGDYPKLITDKATCYKCKGDRAFWQAHSYASGLTNIRIYNLCLNCTWKPESFRSLSPPKIGSVKGGQYRCRICGDRGSDILLLEESEGIKNFQVPIHKDCREKLFNIQNKAGKRWWDVPHIVKIEI